MSKDLYDFLALVGRYVFAGLMLLIVFRAWRITIVDNRRARQLRQMTPQTGLSGELVVLRGGQKAKEGMRYPVIREGILGSARRADIRIRHGSVERIHAFFQLKEDGLRLRANGKARIARSRGKPERELLLRDGDRLEVGDVRLLLVLSGGQGGEGAAEPEIDEEEDLFAVLEREGAEGVRSARERSGEGHSPRKASPRRGEAEAPEDLFGDEEETTLAEDLFGPEEGEPPEEKGRRKGRQGREDLWL